MRIAGFRSRGLFDEPPDLEPRPLTAVLFDFSNTLFHATDTALWLRAGAAAVGREMTEDTALRLVAELEQAWQLPEVVAAQDGRDLSTEAHRQAGLAWIRAVEELIPLAEPLYERLTSPESWIPYDDTQPVLAQLRARGVPVGVVSDIAWDIRPTFAYYGLDELVDAYALSYEHGVGKPDPKLFRHACEQLDVDPWETLMVGDTPVSDGGATALGMRCYLVPAEGALARHRGLDAVLRIMSP